MVAICLFIGMEGEYDRADTVGAGRLDNDAAERDDDGG